MSFLRNPEAKRLAVIHLILTSAIAAAGFIISPPIGVGCLFICLIFDLLALVSAKTRYKKIAALSDEVDRILHGYESYNLDQFSEGELSILQSELVKMTIRLREQAEQLQADKLYLADSLADISHQIKTPLTSINLAVALLAEPNLPQDRRVALIGDISRSLGRIEWLISTLLKISRLDAGAIDLRRDNVRVRNLIQAASAPLEIAMDLHNLKFAVECPDNASITVDMAWSTEAIGNILKNSVEHTPDGGNINVTVTDTSIFVQIEISDSGEGFSDADLPRLFERFYKGHGSSEQSVGIGLALSRMIITRQNGSVIAENGQNGGALFTIRFYKGIV